MLTSIHREEWVQISCLFDSKLMAPPTIFILSAFIAGIILRSSVGCTILTSAALSIKSSVLAKQLSLTEFTWEVESVLASAQATCPN